MITFLKDSLILSNYRSNYSAKPVLSIVWKREVIDHHISKICYVYYSQGKEDWGQTPTPFTLWIINCDSSTPSSKKRQKGRKKKTLSCQCSLVGMLALHVQSFSPQNAIMSVW